MAHPSYQAVRFDSAESGEGQTVRRYDRGELKPAEKTPEGFLRAEGFIARSGVFTYHRPDGTSFTELRHPDEVFNEEAIKSFALVPLTFEHPPKNLHPFIVREHQVGSVGQPRRDGDRLRADILITDPKAIAEAEKGKTGLSGGYDTVVFPVPGTWVDESGREHRFDSYQTKIRGNHVAQTDSPRLGADIRMRMDSADAVQRDDAPAQVTPIESKNGAAKRQDARGAKTVKITVNGKEHEVPDEVAGHIQGLQGQVEAASKSRADSTDLASMKAEMDRMRGELAAATADLKSRQDSQREIDAKKKEDEAITARAEVIILAAPILQKKPDELLRMDSMEIMRAVVKAESPSTPIDGEPDAYVRGIFRHVTRRVDSAKALGSLIDQSKGKTQQEAQRRADAAKQGAGNVAKEARTKMLKEAEGAWKTAPANTPAS